MQYLLVNYSQQVLLFQYKSIIYIDGIYIAWLHASVLKKNIKMTIIILFTIAAISLFLFPYAFALMLAAKIVHAKHQTYKIALLAAVYLIVIALIQGGVLYMLGKLETYDSGNWFSLFISLFIDSWIVSRVFGISYPKGILVYFISGLISAIFFLVIAVLMLFSGVMDKDFNSLLNNTNSQEETQSLQIEQLEGKSVFDELD